MRHYKFFLLLFFFISCKNRDSEIKELLIENAKLQARIDSIYKTLQEYSFSPKVIAKNNEIKLGEEYIADISLAVFNKKNPPIVILGHSNDSDWAFTPNGDTLKFDEEYLCATYRITPNKIGNFIWEGQVISNASGQKDPLQFSVEYTVKKK